MYPWDKQAETWKEELGKEMQQKAVKDVPKEKRPAAMQQAMQSADKKYTSKQEKGAQYPWSKEAGYVPGMISEIYANMPDS